MTRMIRKYNRFAQKEMAMEDFQKVRDKLRELSEE